MTKTLIIHRKNGITRIVMPAKDNIVDVLVEHEIKNFESLTVEHKTTKQKS